MLFRSQVSDEFMLLRIKMMQKMAKKIRVLLPAAMLFSPGMKTRRKALDCMGLFRESLGRMSLKTRIASFMLILTGLVETLRLVFARIRGRESIIRQPSSRRVEYPLSALTVMNHYSKPVRITPLGMDNY